MQLHYNYLTSFADSFILTNKTVGNDIEEEIAAAWSSEYDDYTMDSMVRVNDDVTFINIHFILTNPAVSSCLE